MGRSVRIRALLIALVTAATAGAREPSADELAWGRRVAAALNLPEGRLARIERPDANQRKPGEPYGRGVRLELEGLTVERVRFASPEIAQAYVEVMGEGSGLDRRLSQTVRLEGPLATTRAGRTARRTAWKDVAGAAQALAAERDATPPRVLVVAIDARTLAALGPFGGSYRARHARLVDALDALGARGVAFDVSFPENPQAEVGTRALAEAASRSRAPVVVATNVQLDEAGDARLEPNAEALRGVRTGAVLSQPELVVHRGADGALEARAGERLILAEVAGLRPLVAVLAEATGALAPGDLERLGLVEDAPVGANVVDGQAVPVTARAIRPNIRSSRPTAVVSYVDVLERRVDPSLVRDALVVVGMDDGAHDLVEGPNPAAPGVARIAGVHLHAAALHRALQARHRGRPVARPRPEGIDPLEEAEVAGMARAVEQRFERD